MDFLKEILMKFKPIYFYGIIITALIIVLVIISQQDNKIEKNDDVTLNEQQMPQDDIHSQFRNEGNAPGKENLSEEYHKKLAELKEAVDANPNDTLALKQYADYLAAAHQLDEAINAYTQILNVDPSRIDILFNLSFIYYNERNLDKADELNNKVLKLIPDNVQALYNKGAILATRGNKEQAKEIWTKIVEEFPESETKELARQSLNQL